MYVLTKCQFEPNTHVCRRHVCLTKIKVTCLLFCRFLLYMKQKMQNDRHVFLTFVKDTCLLMKINRHVCLTFVNLRSKTHVCRFSFFVPPRDRSPRNLRLSELRRRGRVVSDASDPGGRKHRYAGRPETSLRRVINDASEPEGRKHRYAGRPETSLNRVMSVCLTSHQAPREVKDTSLHKPQIPCFSRNQIRLSEQTPIRRQSDKCICFPLNLDPPSPLQG